MSVHELFEKHDGEFLKFERITDKDRRHPRPDLCAFLYLHERFGGKGDMVCGAQHDVIFLDAEPDQLTEEDVIYLRRCGVRYDSEVESLAMFA